MNVALVLFWVGTWAPGALRVLAATDRPTGWQPSDVVALVGSVLSFIGLIAVAVINSRRPMDARVTQLEAHLVEIIERLDPVDKPAPRQKAVDRVS